jgi:phenylalanyl-tRNA synthetase beta chain
LQGVEVFDIYRGQGVGEGRKSVALALKIQHQERTLQDEEVDTLVSQVIDMAKEKVQAELRQ